MINECVTGKINLPNFHKNTFTNVINLLSLCTIGYFMNYFIAHAGVYDACTIVLKC